MTAVALADSNNQRNAATSATNWSSEGGGGSGPGVEPDFIYSGGISRKVGTTLGGFKFVDPSTVDMTVEADNTVMLKANWTNNAALLAAAPTATLWVGSSTSAYNRYDIHLQATYPPKGGWQIVPINPNLVHWIDVVVGNPDETAIDTYVFRGDFSTSAKAENLIASAIDISPGLFLTGGTGADDRGTWNDFLVYDETGGSATRIGHVSALEGIPQALLVFGTLGIGRAAVGSPTAELFGFEDQDAILFFGGGLVDAGWNRILIDLSVNGDGYINTRGVFTGLGRIGHQRFFSPRDTSSNRGHVDDDADERVVAEIGGINIGAFADGEAVLYSRQGGSANIGLTDDTVYFVGLVGGGGGFTQDHRLYNSRNDAITDTNEIDLTGVAASEEHVFTRAPDTRPDYVVEGTADSHLEDSSVFTNFRNFLLTSACNMLNCTFNNVKEVDLNGGSLDGCNFNGSSAFRSEALVHDTTLNNIVDCTFFAPSVAIAPAVEIESAGTYTFDGNLFTSPSGQVTWGPDFVEFNTETQVSSANDSIADAVFSGTDWENIGTVMYAIYHDRGGSEDIGLVDGQIYYMVDRGPATGWTLHISSAEAENNNNPVNLTASGAGNGETHRLSHPGAMLYNSSGGAVTVNVTGGGDTPTVRDAPGSTTTINNTVTLTVTVVDEAGDPIEDAQVAIYDNSLTQLMNELSNASGVATEQFNYVSDTPVSVRVRKSTLPGTRYVPVRSNQTITVSGLSLTVTLQVDSVAST